MSVHEGLPGPMFNAFISVVLCVHDSRAGRFPDFVLFAPGSDVGVPSMLPLLESSGALW